MQITVNGESKKFSNPMTLGELLRSFGINPKSVVVERNLKMVDRSLLDQESVGDGDSIEIIRFVGGG